MLWGKKSIRNKNLNTMYNLSGTFIRIFMKFCSEWDNYRKPSWKDLILRFSHLCTQRAMQSFYLKLMDENMISVSGLYFLCYYIFYVHLQ